MELQPETNIEHHASDLLSCAGVEAKMIGGQMQVVLYSDPARGNVLVTPVTFFFKADAEKPIKVEDSVPNWLPMKTAPRDRETEILLLTRSYGVCQAWWMAAEGSGEDFEGLCWVCCDDEFTIEQPSEESMVLGWMHLPPGTPKIGDVPLFAGNTGEEYDEQIRLAREPSN